MGIFELVQTNGFGNILPFTPAKLAAVLGFAFDEIDVNGTHFGVLGVVQLQPFGCLHQLVTLRHQ
jgi:hypothetical protein